MSQSVFTNEVIIQTGRGIAFPLHGRAGILIAKPRNFAVLVFIKKPDGNINMAGFNLLTNVERDRALDIAEFVATELGYQVYQLEDDELKVRKGNLMLVILFGIFAGPYCDFQVIVTEDKKGRVEIEITRNNPWWTGLIGISQVKTAARRLAEEIEDEIEGQGGRVLDFEEL